MRVKVKAKIKRAEEIKISTEYIKLDSFLKFANAVESGGMAKTVIADGQVAVNGETCTQRGKKLRPGDQVEIFGGEYVVAAEG